LCVPPAAPAGRLRGLGWLPGEPPAAGAVPDRAGCAGWLGCSLFPAAPSADGAGVARLWRARTPANPATAPTTRYHGARFIMALPLVRGRTPRGGWPRPAPPGA